MIALLTLDEDGFTLWKQFVEQDLDPWGDHCQNSRVYLDLDLRWNQPCIHPFILLLLYRMIFSAAVTGDSLVRIFLFHTLIRPPAQTSGCWRPKALQTLATPPPSGFTEFIHRPRFETSLPGWWCPTRGARRGWAAGLTGNWVSSKTLQRAIFTSNREVLVAQWQLSDCCWGGGHTTSWQCRADQKVQPTQVNDQIEGSKTTLW